MYPSQKKIIKNLWKVNESKGHEVKNLHLSKAYNVDDEIKHIMRSDVVILQKPGWCVGLPWCVKHMASCRMAIDAKGKIQASMTVVDFVKERSS